MNRKHFELISCTDPLSDTDYEYLIDQILHVRHLNEQSEDIRYYEIAKTFATLAKYISYTIDPREVYIDIHNSGDDTSKVSMVVIPSQYSYNHTLLNPKTGMFIIVNFFEDTNPSFMISLGQCENDLTVHANNKDIIYSNESQITVTDMLEYNIQNTAICTYDMIFPNPSYLGYLILNTIKIVTEELSKNT